MTTLHETTTNDQAQAPAGGHRCLICRDVETSSPYDACDACKARMFDEYVNVKGGL